MEFRHLRYFCAVAEALNFTRAAEQLHVSQPSLSRQIKELEDEIGSRLLDRNRQRVRLTDAGRLFVGHAQKMLAQADLAILSVREVDSGAEGELRIGHDWRVPTSMVSDAVAEYRRCFPRVKVVLRDLHMSDQLVALHAHKIHLGFLVASLLSPSRQLASRHLLHTEIVAIVPSEHPLAGRGTVRLTELKNEEWITVVTADNGYRAFLMQDCRRSGFVPQFSHATATQPAAVVGLVAAGMGVALLPRLSLTTESSSVAILGTDSEPLDICAVWNENDHSPLLKNFMLVLGQQKKTSST